MDYQKVGLKAGLEIHQQLDTGKLFSRTPSYLRSDSPNFTIKRKLHKVAGETGEVDKAVQYESSLNKELTYEGYFDTTSLVELDESPPQPLDQEALEEALKIALLLNCEIFPVSQIMRKTVIDGSNTSGFQRTFLIAHSGSLKTSFGEVKIESIALEEDSARIISKEKDKAIYRLDRLGIPLVEITTTPTMFHPEEVKETALKLGEILRACKVKRGIGTIRQDINVSIKGHDKVEIKGFQEPGIMVSTINLEVERQLENLKLKKKDGEVRNALANGKTEFLRPLPGKARMYPETDLPILKIPKPLLDKIRRSLPKLRSEIRAELEKIGLSPELINLVLEKTENLEEFETLIKLHEKDASLIAKMITLWRKELSVKLSISLEEIKKLTSLDKLKTIIEALNENIVEKSDIKKIMEDICSEKSVDEATKIEKISFDELEEQISKIIASKPSLSPNAYMGLIMKDLKGKLDAKKASEIINKLLKK